MNVIINKMIQLPSKIFIDGGDPEETAKAKKLLGYIDGQTTNPSLVTKNPTIKKYIESGKKFKKEELLLEYKKIVQEVAKVTTGPCSIEVYAHKNSSAQDLLIQASEMFSWIPNAYIKFPIFKQGLEAAGKAVAEGIRVNMTLCFTQEQAAAVYAATKITKSPLFISPFVGRLDDIGLNGMDVAVNILEMYRGLGDGHVHVLTASVRNLDHLLYALQLKSEAITVPFKVFEQWAEKKFILPDDKFIYDPNFGREKPLREIPYKELSLDLDIKEYDLHHDLTDKGLSQFAADWESLII